MTNADRARKQSRNDEPALLSISGTPPTGSGRELLPERTPFTLTHRRLLERALELFAERGFHGVTVREIADAVGIRAPSIYKHLDSKQDLLFQLSVIGHEEHRDRLIQAVEEANDAPIDQLRALVKAHVTVHAEFCLLARVANRELHSLTAENRVLIDNIREGTVAVFMSVIGRGIDEGVFEAPDRWLAVASIGAMGLRVAEWWDDFPGYEVDDVAETYATFALRLLGH